jgi:hypothetical protein
MYVSRSPSIIYFVSDKKIFNNILIDQWSLRIFFNIFLN